MGAKPARHATPPPLHSPVARLTADPAVLPATGGTVTLSWTARNALNCSLSATGPISTSSYGSPGSGSLAALIGDSPNDVVCAGKISLVIGEGTGTAQKWTFTLTADSAQSLTSAQATLTEDASSSYPPATTTTTANPAPVVSPTTTTASGPPVNAETSGNWSGYAVDGSGLTNVSGTFTVPELYNTAQCKRDRERLGRG